MNQNPTAIKPLTAEELLTRVAPWEADRIAQKWSADPAATFAEHVADEDLIALASYWATYYGGQPHGVAEQVLEALISGRGTYSWLA